MNSWLLNIFNRVKNQIYHNYEVKKWLNKQKFGWKQAKTLIFVEIGTFCPLGLQPIRAKFQYFRLCFISCCTVTLIQTVCCITGTEHTDRMLGLHHHSVAMKSSFISALCWQTPSGDRNKTQADRTQTAAAAAYMSLFLILLRSPYIWQNSTAIRPYSSYLTIELLLWSPWPNDLF